MSIIILIVGAASILFNLVMVGVFYIIFRKYERSDK